ncbi:hypothetical protein EL17_18535 [Anditalea andensis]|uniref:Uncharacterized protein n=1 Tax=Anditalea andensis TaxID=1048983 RepID=A0A074KYN9_9BACT|nr:hypothetical protein EL17_18535 [Anditalea andensis]
MKPSMSRSSHIGMPRQLSGKYAGFSQINSGQAILSFVTGQDGLGVLSCLHKLTKVMYTPKLSDTRNWLLIQLFA